VGTFPIAIAAGDLNGDGRTDLVVSNRKSKNVSVLLGIGGGRFGPAPRPIQVGKSPGGVALADVDGDTKPDLVVANGGSNNVSVLLGDGSGGFGTAASFAVGSAPAAV